MRLTFAAVFLSALFGAPAFGASFDCAKAATGVEKRICADPVASQLDEEMHTAYEKALDNTIGAAAIRRWQRTWLKSRAHCPDVECLRKALTERIAVLSAVAPLATEAGAYTGYYVRHAGLLVDKHYADLLLVGMQDGRVMVEGSAIWLGPKADEGQVNTGEIAGSAKPAGKALQFDDDACRVMIMLNQGGVAVTDNHQCGGQNVSFNGSYRKMQK
jgi:uncharacterized protein